MAELFSKILSCSDVTQKFAVPSYWLGKLLPKLDPNGKATICVLDQTGREYRFVLKARKENDGPQYLKPVFQRQGWRDFVGDHNLVAEDTIYFWKERHGRDDIIRVHVRDPPTVLRLFGFNVSPLHAN